MDELWRKSDLTLEQFSDDWLLGGNHHNSVERRFVLKSIHHTSGYFEELVLQAVKLISGDNVFKNFWLGVMHQRSEQKGKYYFDHYCIQFALKIKVRDHPESSLYFFFTLATQKFHIFRF